MRRDLTHSPTRDPLPLVLGVSLCLRCGAFSPLRHLGARETRLSAEVQAEVDDTITRIWTEWGLEALSPKQRLAVILHHMLGLPVADVARASGSSTETVRTHLKRARVRLRTPTLG